MFLHENDRTWLAVYNAAGRTSSNRIENPLIVAPDLTVGSSRLSERMCARDDRQVHKQLADALLTTKRFEWSDIGFGTLWGLIGAYEATNEAEWLSEAVRYATTLLETAATDEAVMPHEPHNALVQALPFLALDRLTNDRCFGDAVRNALPSIAEAPGLETGGAMLLQSHFFVDADTRAYLLARSADGGTYSEQVGLYYPSVLAAAHLGGWQNEAADKIAACLDEHRANCRDEATGLYYHGALGKRHGLEGIQGHGMLWTCFGLMHLAELWPTDHSRQGDVVTMLRNACDAAAAVQDPDSGGFHHILNMPHTPYARIYTPALAYVLMRGARLGMLGPEHREAGRRAWNAVKRHVFAGGNFGGDCGTPQSKRLEYYMMQPITYDYHVVRDKSFWQLHPANEMLRLSG